jgi:hypothetical protein
MKQRLPLIAFVAGLVVSDLTYRLTKLSAYRTLVVVALVAAGIGYLLREMNELVRDYAFPFFGGFAAGGVIKGLIYGMLG